jgi:hypothetical protein
VVLKLLVQKGIVEMIVGGLFFDADDEDISKVR